MSLKLIQLNIERNKHWDKVLPFLEREDADVLCLQEIFACDIPKLEMLGYRCQFGQIATFPYDFEKPDELFPQGVVLASRPPLHEAAVHHYYAAPQPELPQALQGSSALTLTAEDKRAMTHQTVVTGAVQMNNTQFVIASTHFTWTRQGRVANDFQKHDMQSLLEYLKRYPSLLLTGDFNIPRHQNELYEQLAQRYQDHVPESVTSTMDVDVHYAGHIPEIRADLEQYVVDYIFSTPDYQVKNVRTQFGVSDHCALIAEVSKV